jgi:hypothetical protein
MTNATDYLENQIIDHLFRTNTFGKLTNVFFALFTAAPTDAAGSGTEVTGGSYARVQVACNNNSFNATQGGTSGASTGAGGGTTNAAAITFPAPSANWGTVSHYGVFDALSGGNMLIWGALNSPKTINGGDAAPSFTPGNLAITVA